MDPALFDLNPDLNIHFRFTKAAAIAGESLFDEIMPPISWDFITNEIYFQEAVENLGLDLCQAKLFSVTPALDTFGRIKLLDPGIDILLFVIFLPDNKTIRSRPKYLGVS